MDLSLMSVDICLGNDMTTSAIDSSGVPFRLVAMSVPVSFELDCKEVAEPLQSPPAVATAVVFITTNDGYINWFYTYNNYISNKMYPKINHSNPGKTNFSQLRILL